jgi:metal-dependent amidase/aminoacylase/carboxypeptidase family protein
LVGHRSTAAQIVLGLQTIISRNLNIAETGAVISVGKLMLEYEAM